MLYVWGVGGGGLPYFPENDNQVFGAGFGCGAPFSKNCSSGIGIGYQLGVVVSTPLGTRKLTRVQYVSGETIYGSYSSNLDLFYSFL